MQNVVSISLCWKERTKISRLAARGSFVQETLTRSMAKIPSMRARKEGDWIDSTEMVPGMT